MTPTPPPLLQQIARNYLVCLADFPPELKPEHLDAPPGEQAAVFAGLVQLHSTMRSIYEYYTGYEPEGECWEDRDYCTKTIEALFRLLCALGASGQVVESPQGSELAASRAELDQTLKLRPKIKLPAAFAGLVNFGFGLAFRSAGGRPAPGGYKQCAEVALRYLDGRVAGLRALKLFAARFSLVKNAPPFELFLRADFRPLLPGFQYSPPHLPASEAEIVRTFDPAEHDLWQTILQSAASRHPQLKRFYRVPRLSKRSWIVDFCKTEKAGKSSYGIWSLIGEEGGVRMRLVLKDKGLAYLMAHLDVFSPRFQEIYLNCSACTDCIRCGKHVFYQHGDHTHRLCMHPWFYSPYLILEDLPDVERLVDIHLANLS